MDNVTHSLVGMAFGNALPADGPDYRRAVMWTAVLGSNFPDLDFVLKPLLGGGHLGYLLEHRGYTHTVIATIPQALFIAWLAMGIAKVDRSRFKNLFLIASAALLGHIGADFWNDYGIHPFFPWVNRWFYGDFIFIVEPCLWAVLFPFAFLSARSTQTKWTLGGMGVLMAGVAFFSHYLPLVAKVWLAGLAVVMFLAQRRWRDARPVLVGGLLVLLAFATGSQVAKSRVRSEISRQLPQERILDVSTTPSPGDPFCWRILALSERRSGLDGTDYVARVGVLSLMPSVLDPESCYIRRGKAELQTAPLVPVALGSFPGVSWKGAFLGQLKTWEELKRNYCAVRAASRFVRVPFWAVSSTGGEAVFGDLRYDRERELGFAEVLASRADTCQFHIPDWTEPFNPS